MEVMKNQSIPSNKETTYKCEICKDIGGYIEKRDDIEFYITCKCIEQIRKERILKSSKITIEFRKKTFQNWDTSWLHEIVRNAHSCSLKYIANHETIMNNRQNSIALLGRSGAGKTHLLSAICNRLLDKNIPIIYFPFVEGFNELKDNFDLLETKINEMQKVDYLFIDDLFKGRVPTQFQIEQVFAIINYRYINNKPILISSEKTINDLLQIDEALGSRIYEMTKDYLVELNENNLNYRLREIGE